MTGLKKCIPPLLKKRDHQAMLSRIQSAMKEAGFEYLVLTHIQDTFYATGYLPLMTSAVSVVPVQGDAVLIVSTLESEAAYCLTPEAVEVRTVKSWVFIDDGSPESRTEKGTIIDPDGAAGVVLDILLKKPLQGRVGIDFRIVPKYFWDKLAAKVPEHSFADCARMLEEVRIFKTPWEVDVLRLAAQEAEKAYKMIADDLKPGMPAWKVDALYAYYSAKLNLDHGAMSRESSFLTSQGPHYGLSGMPRGYILKKGDAVKLDCGFPYLGHTSDIARTVVVGGEASDEVQEIYNTLYRAYRLGVDMLRPGVKLKDIYWTIRRDVEKSRYIPHYPRGNMGHSIGCGQHAEEYPTVSRDRETILQPGMVVCLETPYSATGNAPVHGGYNIEDTFAITENGYEAFTTAPDNIFWK